MSMVENEILKKIPYLIAKNEVMCRVGIPDFSAKTKPK